jgi:hypothetical protein|tara:strand:+ start:552 stop:878 length:327 start_codon:yes stop_codon:yes gene_type:complete
MPPHKQPYMNTYRSYSYSKKTTRQNPQHNTNSRDLLRVRVYAKIEQLRQRIYNWETNNDQWEEDLKFVDNQQENMEDDETYYPHSNTLMEMNTLWIEYKGKLCDKLGK